MRAKVGIGRTKDGKVVVVMNNHTRAVAVTREEAIAALPAELEKSLLRPMGFYGTDGLFLDEEEIEIPGTGRSAASAFNPGDVVKLNSGGPHMTVNRVEGEGVHCLRLNDRGEVLKSDFAASLLEMVRKAD